MIGSKGNSNSLGGYEDSKVELDRMALAGRMEPITTHRSKIDEPLNGSHTFYKLLDKAAQIHNKKSHDYASNENPSGNYHFAGKLALLFSHSEQDAGFIGRIGEKLYRLANLEKSSKTPLNESIEDTEEDLITIMVLWMADRRDRRVDADLPESVR